jgi:hypothetical protein
VIDGASIRSPNRRLSHCVFQTTGEIVDTCCDAWNWLPFRAFGIERRMREEAQRPQAKIIADEATP